MWDARLEMELDNVFPLELIRAEIHRLWLWTEQKVIDFSCIKLPLQKSNSNLQVLGNMILSVSNPSHTECGEEIPWIHLRELMFPRDWQMHRSCSPGLHHSDQPRHSDGNTCAWDIYHKPADRLHPNSQLPPLHPDPGHLWIHVQA